MLDGWGSPKRIADSWGSPVFVFLAKWQFLRQKSAPLKLDFSLCYKGKSGAFLVNFRGNLPIHMVHQIASPIKRLFAEFDIALFGNRSVCMPKQA